MSRDSSILQQLFWFRIVLDEGMNDCRAIMLIKTLINTLIAHVIRHQSTKQFRAIHSLNAERRWCLTGTPIQNRLEDIGSLIMFLRVTPFDSNTMFRKHISDPLLTDRQNGDRNLRLLLGSLCLRRTRSLLKLPDAKDQIILLNLSEAERSSYDDIIEESRRRIDDFISSKSITKAYNGIFQAILRLRLLCNHGTLSTKSYPDSGILDEISVISHKTPLGIQEGGKAICAFCSHELTVSDMLNIGDSSTSRTSVEILCLACLSQNDVRLSSYKQTRGDQYTTSANQANSNDYLQYRHADAAASRSPRPADNGYSSKLSRLVKNIEQNKEGNKRYTCIQVIMHPV
jgi:SWI/SNF-related matrix-associated actin-dependent regulator of chromatin subfamily A3